MATTAAPAGGARSGAGPEWGGFEENIQVIASRLRLLPAPGLAAAPRCRGDRPSELGSPFHLQHLFSPLDLGIHEASGTSAELKGPG